MEQDIKNIEAEIDAIKEDLLPKVSVDCVTIGQGQAKSPFDTSQTERYGIILAEDKSVRGLEGLLRDRRRVYNNLREARATLDKDETQFIWLRYDKGKSHMQTWMALSDVGACMSERSYFRFRQIVINKIARYIGLCSH